MSEPLDPTIEPAKPKPFESMGAFGTAIYGGYIVESEKDARLSGLEKYRTYSNILANTAIVAAGVRYFLNLVGKANWRVEPADSSEQAEVIAETIADIMTDMVTPWHRVVRRAAMYRFYGFSLQEWTAKRRGDGAIGMYDIAPRPQKTIERWDVTESGEVRGVIQRSPQTMQEIYLPRPKLIYLVDDSLDDSPQGLGLFRHIAPKAETLSRYELLEGWGFERDLRGTPIGRGPLSEMSQMLNAGTLTAEQVTTLRAPIEQFVKNALKGKDTGLVLDSAVYRGTGESQTPSTTPQWNVELLQGSTNSQPDMARAIERLNREMARILGVEHLLLGADSSGSFALSKDKTQSFGMIVTSTLQEIKESFEADFLAPLFDLNGWDMSLWPTLKVEQIQFRDIEQITGALADMAQSGATLTPDDPAVNEVRDMLGLSSVPEVETPDTMVAEGDATMGEEDEEGGTDLAPEDEEEEVEVEPEPSESQTSDVSVGEDEEEDEEEEEEPDMEKAVSRSETLARMAREHNAEYGDKGRVTARTLAAVFDRGVGAYRTNPSSVRPNVRSPEQWAYARVKNFLRTIRTGRFRSGAHDTDLLPSKHPLAKARSYQPPAGAKGNAAKVLRWKRLYGSAVKGMTPVGWARARQLASGRPVGRDTVSRMAQFNRHRKNAVVDPKFKTEPWRDAGYVAWLGWGGDTGVNWAIRTMQAEKN